MSETLYVRLKGEAAKKFKAIKKHMGLENDSEVVRSLITWYYQQLPPERPELEHFNVAEDHVTVMDHKRKMYADVYFRGNKVFCQLCSDEDCEHVEYALNIPKLQKLLRKKGWVIEDGKIIQRPT